VACNSGIGAHFKVAVNRKFSGSGELTLFRFFCYTARMTARKESHHNRYCGSSPEGCRTLVGGVTPGHRLNLTSRPGEALEGHKVKQAMESQSRLDLGCGVIPISHPPLPNADAPLTQGRSINHPCRKGKSNHCDLIKPLLVLFSLKAILFSTLAVGFTGDGLLADLSAIARSLEEGGPVHHSLGEGGCLQTDRTD
jgi:hypothetical protein